MSSEMFTILCTYSILGCAAVWGYLKIVEKLLDIQLKQKEVDKQ